VTNEITTTNARGRSLYEITAEIVAIGQRLADPVDDADFEAALADLDRLDMDMARKGENVVNFLRHLAAQIDEAKNEEQRIRAWRKSRENANDKLRENLRDAMFATGTKKIAWTGGSVTLVEPKKAKLVVDVAMLPDEYTEEKITKTRVALTEKIEAALATGANIPGASYAFSRPHILVK
jgi:hypothetical protein